MKKRLILVLILIFSLVFAAFAEEEEAEGTSFGDFTITLSDGSEFTLSKALTEHEVLVINIWGIWCPWCVYEFPFMEEAWEPYQDRIGLVCLSAYDTNEDIAAFKEENGIKLLPMGYDAYNVTGWLVYDGYPTTAAFDSDGYCIYYDSGALTSTEQWTALFEALLEEEND